jgi:tetratricopeptide (TPR) repeat protein
MGNILDDAQRYDDAVKAYESALAIRDNDDLTYYNLGIAYKHANQPAMAVQSWKKGISINPGNQKIRLAMADYYLERGYPDLAEKEYQRFLTNGLKIKNPCSSSAQYITCIKIMLMQKRHIIK